MPQHDIMSLVFGAFEAQAHLDLDALINLVKQENPELEANEIRSAVLGLLRRQELKLNPNFELELRGPVAA